MKIAVKVITSARAVRIVPDVNGLKVYLTSPPVDGKANIALVSVLADYYAVKSSCITITKGLKSRNKIISINDI